MKRLHSYANVAFIDEWVGKILGALDQRDLTQHTFIIWTADHGDGQADHHHWRKGFPYQFSANVPLILRWPESYEYAAKTPRGTVITELVTELRDIFPTMLHAAGAMDTIPAGHTLDGSSLLCLLHDATGAACRHQGGGQPAGPGWRPWLDLEHATCYNATNHWSALTDGKMKYIFNACPTCSFPPREQLFNVSADPGERHGLHADPAYRGELAKWRGHMVRQFEAEGRGDAWVKGGVLQPRSYSQIYSPNFPGHHTWWPGSICRNVSLTVGDKLNLWTGELEPSAFKLKSVCFVHKSPSVSCRCLLGLDLEEARQRLHPCLVNLVNPQLLRRWRGGLLLLLLLVRVLIFFLLLLLLLL